MIIIKLFIFCLKFSLPKKSYSCVSSKIYFRYKISYKKKDILKKPSYVQRPLKKI